MDTTIKRGKTDTTINPGKTHTTDTNDTTNVSKLQMNSIQVI